MAEPQLQSTITCPHCGHRATEQMPTNVCVVIYACKGCGEELKPLPEAHAMLADLRSMLETDWNDERPEDLLLPGR